MNTPSIVGIISFIFCLWMLRHALKNYRKATLSVAWPNTKGRMLEVELWGKRNIGGEQQEVEKLSVKYQYTVEGKEYVGTNVTFYTLVYPETIVFSKKYPVDSEVSVHYCAENPLDSVLVPGLRGGAKAYGEIILASMGLVISMMVATFGILGVLD